LLLGFKSAPIVIAVFVLSLQKLNINVPVPCNLPESISKKNKKEKNLLGLLTFS
jgi:hypothetical protein